MSAAMPVVSIWAKRRDSGISMSVRSAVSPLSSSARRSLSVSGWSAAARRPARTWAALGPAPISPRSKRASESAASSSMVTPSRRESTSSSLCERWSGWTRYAASIVSKATSPSVQPRAPRAWHAPFASWVISDEAWARTPARAPSCAGLSSAGSITSASSAPASTIRVTSPRVGRISPSTRRARTGCAFAQAATSQESSARRTST